RRLAKALLRQMLKHAFEVPPPVTGGRPLQLIGEGSFDQRAGCFEAAVEINPGDERLEHGPHNRSRNAFVSAQALADEHQPVDAELPAHFGTGRTTDENTFDPRQLAF